MSLALVDSTWALCGKHLVFQIAGAIVVVLVVHFALPFVQTPMADDARYLLLARDLRFDGGVLYRDRPDVSIIHAPGYPWLLSFFVERDSLGWAPIVQRIYLGMVLIIGSGWATITCGVGVGWLVFLLLAINPALVASSSRLASESPHAVLYLVGFLAWFRFIRTGCIRSLILSIGCLACSTYLRSYSLLLLVFLPLLILIRFHQKAWRVQLLYIGGILTVWVLVLAPWTLRNYERFGQFVPMTMTGGALYSAWFPPGLWKLGMMADDEVTRQAETILDPFERDKFYRQETIRKIVSDPVNSLTATFRKYMFYLMPLDWEFFGRPNKTGRVRPSLHFVYVFLFPFMAGYVWQNRRDINFWTGPMAPILFGLFMTGVVYGIPRLRLCVEPFLTIFASMYLAQWLSINFWPRGMVVVGYFLACVVGGWVFTHVVT